MDKNEITINNTINNTVSEMGEKRFNYGLALLRMLMCFEVVLCHCWTTNVPFYLKPFDIIKTYAVPVFMIMSFLLNQKTFSNRNVRSSVRRVWKLVLPQIIWTIIYFVVYCIVGAITHNNIVNGLSDFLWQLFTGHSPRLNATMWFQFDLIVITILFFVIFYFFKQKAGQVIMIVLGGACIVLQYSGINFRLFSNLRYELSYPIGRLIETIPMASFGFLFAKYNLHTPIKNNKWNLLIATILGIIFYMIDTRININNYSFGYAGIGKIGVATSLIMFALNLNFNALHPKLLRLIKIISQYTLGIYCGHRLIAFFLFSSLSIIFGLPSGYFYQCIIIYVVGFIASWVLSKIPFKWIKNIV